MGVVALIPARGGSKRLPRKNIYPFFGRPLLQYAIEACQRSRHVDRGIYVSTDDKEIADVARSMGALVIERPPHLAEDHVWTQDVLQHAVRYLEGAGVAFDTVARIYCSPQIQTENIDEAIEKLQKYNLWEVFSVNQQGIEDAVIHVLRKKSVWQQALSVYKGIIQTEYIDIHTKEDVEILERDRVEAIQQQSLDFLGQLEHRYNHQSLWAEMQYILGRSRYLWQWQMRIPLWQRWQAILAASPELRTALYVPYGWQRARSMRVLDLGSGFGMYWPLLREYGIRKFVGIDLFDMRASQAYFAAAQEYIRRFCADCETQLIMDDVRNLSHHDLLFPQFDLILNVATVSTKAGSTGIPHSIFTEIMRKYGTDDCIGIHLEQAH